MNKIAIIDRDGNHELAFPSYQLEGEPIASSDDVAAVMRIIWSAIFRNWWLIVAIVGAALAASIVLTMLMTPKYDASASIQIEQQDAKVLSNDDAGTLPAAQDDADRFLQTQKEILESRALAVRVMNSLGLDRSDKFLEQMTGRPVDHSPGAVDSVVKQRKAVTGLILSNLTVDIPRNSRIATITFRSPDRVLAAQVANSYAKNFISWNIGRKYDSSAYARSFLANQLAVTKEKLEQSERATLAYARKAGLIDASAGLAGGSGDSTRPATGQSLTTSNLVQLNSSYSAAQAARMAAQQRWQQAERTPLMSLPEVIANPTVMQLTQRRAELQSTYQQELQRHQPEYPTMRQAAAQIAELDKQIATLAENVRSTIRDTYLTARKQENALSGGVSVLKASTLSEQDRSVQYNILKRETDTNRTMYDGLLQRFKEVSAAAGLSASNISIIDSAEAPDRPVSPRTMINMVLGFLFGLGLSAIIVLLREKFDDVVRSPDEVQQKLGLPVLSSVPLLRGGSSPPEVLSDPRSAIAEAYAALRAALDLSTASGAPKSLLVTSSRQAEGKSTSAYAIARDFATIGRRVLLIDADLRKPSMHRLLGTTNNVGLTNVMTRNRSFADSVQPTLNANLFFLASGPLPPNPTELLSGPLLPGLLEEAGTQFDMLVIDGPPVLGLADTILLAANIEAAVFVIEANGSHRGHAKAALRRLMAANRNIIGTILTKFDARKVGYGYGYGYTSYYSYGQDEPTGRSRLA